MLPHSYPFRFLDRGDEKEELRLRWTTSGYWSRGSNDLGLSLAVEMMAQASVAEAPLDKRGKSGYLAGIQAAEMKRMVVPGEELIARTRLVGKLGALVKISAQLLDLDGQEVAKADLLLAIDS